MDYDIPTWHPIVVHFPIALLIFGGGLAVLYAATGRDPWRTVTGLAVGLGTLGALVANRTGEALYEQVEGTPIVEELVGRHETFGEWALWLGIAATLAWGGAMLWRRRAALGTEARDPEARDPLGVRLLVAALALAAAVLVALAGHLGGTMVWGIAP